MSETCLLDMINCMLDNQCLAEYPRDGICYGSDEDGLPILKDLNQVQFLRKSNKKPVISSDFLQ